MIVILTSPSCAGKSTIEKKLKDEGFDSIVSITTRSKRSGEVSGKDYFFVTKSEFQEMLFNNEIIEHNIFSGNYYGTGYRSIEPIIKDYEAGNHTKKAVVLDPNGAVNLSNFLISQNVKIPHAIVFIDVDPVVAQARFMDRYVSKINEMINDNSYKNIDLKNQTIRDYAMRITLSITEEQTWKNILPYDLYFEKSNNEIDAKNIIKQITEFEPKLDKTIYPPLNLVDKVNDMLLKDIEAELSIIYNKKIKEFIDLRPVVEKTVDEPDYTKFADI